MKYLPIIPVLLCSLAAGQETTPASPSEYNQRVSELERRYAAAPTDPQILEALAGSYAMGGRYADAIRITLNLITVQPENPAPRLRLANLYSWNGQLDKAIEEVRVLGDRGGTEALELECRLLNWNRDARGAAACYAKLEQEAAPGSLQQRTAELGLARNLAWSGQTKRAIRAYRAYTSAEPNDSVAALEFARVLFYRGHYSAAESVVSKVLRGQPENAVALSLKAEILHWSGYRTHEAASLSANALAIQPNLPEALAAAVYARKDLGDLQGAQKMFAELDQVVQKNGLQAGYPYADSYRYLSERVPEWDKMQIQFPVSEYNDTDSIHETSKGVRISLPLGNQELSLSGRQFIASAAPSSVFSSESGRETANVFSAGTTLHVGSNIQLQSSGGAALLNRGRSRGLFSFGLSGSPVDRWVFQIGADRNIVPLTPKSIAVGLSYTGFQLGATYYFDPRTSATMQFGRALWNDGNKSVTGNFQLQRVIRYSKLLTIDAGPRVRTEAFARDMTSTSGIFTPDLYQAYEAFAGFHGEIGRRLQYEFRPAFGEQRLTSASSFRPSAEIASSLTLKISRTIALSANYDRRNYSLVSGNGSYQGFYLQLGVQP